MENLFGIMSNPSNQFKVAHHSFPKKKIKILKSVKLKQQDVSSEVLLTPIDANVILPKNKCKSGKNAKYSDRAPRGGTGTSSKAFFSKPSSTTPPYNFRISLARKKSCIEKNS